MCTKGENQTPPHPQVLRREMNYWNHCHINLAMRLHHHSFNSIEYIELAHTHTVTLTHVSRCYVCLCCACSRQYIIYHQQFSVYNSIGFPVCLCARVFCCCHQLSCCSWSFHIDHTISPMKLNVLCAYNYFMIVVVVVVIGDDDFLSSITN